MRIQYPKYGNCIANLACSIMKYYKVPGIENPTLDIADRILEKKYKNVVVLLLDGMGTEILKKNLQPFGFFHSHLTGSLSSVFPPTTVASTTSMDSGLYPSQHGWLGWNCYYPQLGETVTVYRNCYAESQAPIEGFNAASTFCPYESVVSRIQKNGTQAYYVSPFQEPYPADLEDICKEIWKLCQEPEEKYIYAYWTQPDSVMHDKGCYAAVSVNELRWIEEQVMELCEELEDTLVLITADHGMVDSQGDVIGNHPEIMECLERMPAMEPRALNLFVKPGMHQQFETAWEMVYGKSFMLMKKEEVLKQELFGPNAAERLDGMLGDYLAAAISDVSIYNSKELLEMFVGVHAGFTAAESEIPLIAIEC